MDSKTDQIPADPYSFPHDASLSPQTTALVVIDMQRDFLEPGGYIDASQGLSFDECRKAIPGIQTLLPLFRSAGYLIYYTRESHHPNLSTLSSRELFRSRNNLSGKGIGDTGPNGRFLVRGQPGNEIIRELHPYNSDIIIDKPGRGAFAHTDFEHILRLRGIRNLIFTGVTTDVCVSSTMREANDRGFDCMVVADATAAATAELHEAALESVKGEGGIFGCVGMVEDIVQAISST